MKRIFLILLVVLPIFSLAFSEEDLFLKMDKVLIETQYKIPINYTKINENVYLFDSNFLKNQNISILKDLIQLISRTYYSRYRSGDGLIFANGIINSHNERFLLLIDGVPINDPFYNQSYIDEYYPLINVKQIEVSFGPFSSLYGTGGFAGYINIIHNKNGDKKVSLSMSSSEKFQPNIILNFKKDNLSMGVVMSYLNDKGVGVDSNLKGEPVLINDFPKENIFLSSYMKYHDLQLKIISIGYRKYELENAMYTWDEILMNRNYNYDFKDMFLILKFNHTFKNNIQMKSSINYFTYDRNSVWGYRIYNSTEIIKTYVDNPKKKSRKISGELQLSYNNDNFNFLYGINWEYIMLLDIKDYEYVNNSDTYEEPSSYYLDPINYFNYAPFAQIGFNDLFKYFNLIASVRYDYNHFFKGFISPKVTLGYNFIKKVHFGFTYGKAFRSPTPREMLIKTSNWTEGNDKLQPEKIESFSFTIKYLHKYFYIFTDIFKQDLNNLIQKIETAPGQYSYENISAEKIWGTNLFFETSIKKLKFTFDITYTYAMVGNKRQYDYPALKTTQTITYNLNGNFNISFANIYVGERERKSWNPLKENGKPYWLNNINFNFHTLNINLSAYIKNIFDVKYYTMYYVEKVTNPDYINDLIMPGRIFGIKASYEF